MADFSEDDLDRLFRPDHTGLRVYNPEGVRAVNYDDWKTTDPRDNEPEERTPAPRPTFSLCDDGTLDTVFRCDQCGEEFRFHFDEHDPDCMMRWPEELPDLRTGQCDRDCYNAFLAQCFADLESDHDCTGEDDDPFI